MSLNLFQINIEHYKNAHWTLLSILQKQIMNSFLITFEHYVMCWNFFLLMSDIIPYVWNIFPKLCKQILHFLNIFCNVIEHIFNLRTFNKCDEQFLEWYYYFLKLCEPFLHEHLKKCHDHIFKLWEDFSKCHGHFLNCMNILNNAWTIFLLYINCL